MEEFQALVQSLSTGDISAIMMAVMGLGFIFVFLMIVFSMVMLIIFILILVYLYNVLKKIPEQFRKMSPGHVFLLLIPLFNIVWMFFVYLRIPESLKAYFDSKNETSVGDCGRQLGLWAAILSAASILSVIPLLGQLIPVASLVVFILFLVKINTLKKMIKD